MVFDRNNYQKQQRKQEIFLKKVKFSIKNSQVLLHEPIQLMYKINKIYDNPY